MQNSNNMELVNFLEKIEVINVKFEQLIKDYIMSN